MTAFYCGWPLTEDAFSWAAEGMLNLADGSVKEFGLGIVVELGSWWVCDGPQKLKAQALKDRGLTSAEDDARIRAKAAELPKLGLSLDAFAGSAEIRQPPQR